MTPDIETAILTLLAERPELYPRQIAAALAARDVGPPAVTATLERLRRQRRVARLWHRYLLPDDVAAVSGRWLAGIGAAMADDPGAAAARAALVAWDGWND